MKCLILSNVVLFLLLTSAICAPSSSKVDDRGVYIVHMDKSAMPVPFSDHRTWYLSLLSSVSSSDEVPPEHLYTYDHVIDGFSVVLSKSQLDQLVKLPGHLAAYPQTFGHLHTTHTPKFLGLSKHAGLWPAAGFGDDMIIGIIDTGVWPESESFRDDGMPPVPERWRGACESGAEFNSSSCNRKLIGARSFSKGVKQSGTKISATDDYDTPRDGMGHGTHTSSTAAGSRVPSADYFGYAKGSPSGIAPAARVAMYKVVYLDIDGNEAASDSDVLASMDRAIADGVDLISLSLGFPETPFDQNSIAIGAFTAMEKGIFVSCSAGNAGPHAYTIFNGAPWITTVGAGTVDRDFVAEVAVDGGALNVIGKSVYPENLLVSRVPVYFGLGNRSKEICEFNSIDPKNVIGKYVFCDIDTVGQVYVEEQLDILTNTGAMGAIFSSGSAPFLRPNDFNLPFVVLNPTEGDRMKDYLIKSGNNATVTIRFQKTVLGTGPAPQVAYFSSRGPARRSPWILKPDILAPGVDIIAAWTPNKASAPVRDDYLLNDYRLVSGTSMASPHLVGIAALIKATHKDWSPAAIRSAMMTTADILDNTGGTIIDLTSGVAGTPLDFGAGHVNPNKAMDPGLVYDMKSQSYVDYLCGLNYTGTQLKTIAKKANVSCENATLDLNYPSFIVILNDTRYASFTFKRVLTSVQASASLYHAVVQAPTGMYVKVTPAAISFPRKYSTAEFNVTVEIDLGDTRSDYIENYGYLSWVEINGNHVVRSPIVSARAP